MDTQIQQVIVFDREKVMCKSITEKLEKYRFDVQSVSDEKGVKNILAESEKAALVLLHVSDDSFNHVLAIGEKLKDTDNALVLFVLDSINEERYKAIQKCTPYGFITADADTFSLLEKLRLAVRIFEEQSINSKLMDEVDHELNSLTTTFQNSTGKEFFGNICKHLAESLNMDFAFVGELVEGEDKVQVHSIYGEGTFMESFEYELSDTPCDNVMGQELCYYGSGVQEQFPKDLLLKEMGIEGYIGAPLFNSSGKPLGIVVLLNKEPMKGVVRYQKYLEIYSERISAEVERLRAEQELREREKELRSINEHISEGIYRSTPNEGLVYINDAFASMFGYSNPEELLEVEAPKLYANEGRRKEITEAEDERGFIKNKEVEFRRKDGSTFWALMSGKVVNDENGNIRYYDGSILDITERKEAEELLKQSLKEKEVLLLEIHHRVKNNLAIISGLLELEAMNGRSDNIKDTFHESQLRIQSMAMIHEKLYQARNFANLKLENYISELAEIIYDTFIKGEKDIEIDIRDCDNVELNINQAIPCALILNELITNAFKYAFETKDSGKLSIHLQSDGDTIALIVKDNGRGLPEDINEQASGSLGLTLVRQLTKQLEGELKVQNENGAYFEIQFAKNDDAGSASSGYIIDRE